ncbi:MAG: hypothetical protein AAF772_13070 [Acidobacteriota bacterium]
MMLAEFDALYGAFVAVPCGLLALLIALYTIGQRAKVHRIVMLVAWNTTFSLFLISLLLAGGETWFRFFVDRSDAIANMLVSQRWYQRHYQLNAQGWRDDVDYHPELQDKKRITFLGDSFTEGVGIEDIRERFSNRLRSWHTDFEIHILAKSGFESDDHLRTVQRLGTLHYQTDAVVLVYTLNDVSFADPYYRGMAMYTWRFEQSMGFLRRNSYFLNTFSYRWTILRSPYIQQHVARIQDAYRGETWQTNADVLRRLHRRVHAAEIPFLVVTFPYLSSLDDYPFAEAHQRLGRLWQTEGVPHLDLLPVLRSHAGAGTSLIVNRWDHHPNETANQIAARAIQGFLASEGVLAPIE